MLDVNDLLRDIPLAEAASFFIRVKSASAAHIIARDGALIEECFKQAAALGAPGTAPELPSASRGMAMPPVPTPALPATAMGQNKVAAPPAWASKAMAEGAEDVKALAPAGVALKERLKRSLKTHGIAAGTGALIGGAVVHDVHTKLDEDKKRHEKKKTAAEAKDPDEVGKERAKASLSAEFEKEKAHKHERRGDMLGRAVGALAGGAAMHRYGRGHALSTLGGVAVGQHMGGKAGREAGAASDRYVHDKLAAAMQQAAQAVGIQPQLPPETQAYVQNEQQAQQAEEQGQAQYLQQQLAQLREQTQEAQAQNEQLQQQQEATSQQMDMYQQQVAQATQQALAAQDQVLQQQRAAASSRMAYQQLRGGLLEMASKDPPGVSGADAAQQAFQAAQAGSAPPDAGPAGQAPSPGTPPGSPAPMGDQPVSQPAGEAAGPDKGSAQPASQTGQTDSPLGQPGQAKTGSLGDWAEPARNLAKKKGKELLARAPHAAVGGALGAGAALAESKMSNEPLRKEVGKLEAMPDHTHSQAMQLAQAKGRLSIGEWAEKHPKSAVGAGALGGAMLGGKSGPAVVQAAKDIKNTGSKFVADIRAAHAAKKNK